MWKYLILNALWFAILFFVHFYGSRMDQLVVFVMLGATACWLAVKGLMDPMAWAYYVSFSLAVFYGARHFHQWAYDRLSRLDEDIASANQSLLEAQSSLQEKALHTKALEVKADEIVEFYDQIKEMSRSLDPLETFFIFCEALSDYFQFDVVKLAFFDENQPDSTHPQQVYELRGRDFRTPFDRAARLKNRESSRGEVFPFDRKIYETVLYQKRGIQLDESKKFFFEQPEAPVAEFAAYPVFIQDRVYAVLTLVGLVTKGDPLIFILIERFVAELQRVKLYEHIQRLAITDGLTGVYVRHHLLERMEGEADRAKRFGLKLSFLMIDIDHFKRFNDEHGHLVGDVVLKQVAQTIKKNVREVDFVGRYGGEEFGVALIETDEATASIVAERIRRAVNEKQFEAYDERLEVSVSVGVATLGAAGTVQALVESSDAAMYQAKRLGRNRVCAAV